MKNCYRNPWHKETLRDSPEFYRNDAPQVLTYRGVTVLRVFPRQYDYVFEGCAITQRAGFGQASARALIDGYLQGTEYVYGAVADHLEAHGIPTKRF